MKENNQLKDNMEKSEIVDDKKKPKVKAKGKGTNIWVWPIKIFFLALVLSLAFGVLSEFILSGAGLVVSIILILFLLAISIVFDMIGVAFTSCSPEPFYAMASKKVKGSKVALNMLKNASKVSSLCCDVIGDICGILSGAAGAAITAQIIITNASNSVMVLVATSVSATIAALTVFGKAMCKNIAIQKPASIVLFVGKICSIFSREGKGSEKKQNKKKSPKQ